MSLIKRMTLSDIRKRYASSYLGIFWIIGQPLLLSAAYIMVFGIFMGEGIPGRRYGGASFVPYYMMGFCLWTFFTDVIGRSAGLLAANRSLITKIKFPHAILSIQCCLSALIPFAVIFCIGVLSLIYRGNFHWPAQFWYPVLSLVLFMMFTLGCSWLIAAVGVFLSDLEQLIGVFLMLWFFATPILYPADKLRERGGVLATLVLSVNPATTAVEMFRAPFFGIHLEWTNAFTYYCLVSVFMLLLGRYVYTKLSSDFADFL